MTAHVEQAKKNDRKEEKEKGEMKVLSRSVQSKAKVLGQSLYPDVCVELNENISVWV